LAPLMSGRKNESEIRSVLAEFADALYRKDAAAAIDLLTADAVTFDLAPPLEQGPHATHDRALLEKWFQTWKGPITSQSQGLQIAVGGDVAYAYALQHMTGTKIDNQESDLWFRATACFRREGMRWRIAHMHNSVPFRMDGSNLALVDLSPD
jgi:PhnB protein